MADQVLKQLLELWTEDNLSDDQFAQLAELLEQDASARAEFIRVQDQEANLYWDYSDTRYATSEPSPSTSQTQPLRPKSLLNWASRHPKGPAIAIAATLLIAALVVMGLVPVTEWVAGGKAKPDEQEVGKKGEFVAKLSNWYNDKWREGTRPPRKDPRLMPGKRLSLKSGFAEITYNNGVVVILEGPAEYEIQTGARGWLELGRLTARAPVFEGKGFVVDTPAAEIEDLGTEFGVNVDRRGNVEVTVFDGKVVTQPAAEGGVPMQLVASQAAKVEIGATTAEIVEPTHRYVSRIRNASEDLTRLDVSDSYVDAIKRSSPVAYWRLSQGTTTSVPNQVDVGNHARRYFGPMGAADPTRMDGASTYLEVSRNVGDDFTLELWLRTTQTSLRGHRAVDGSILLTTDVPKPQNDFAVSLLNDRVAYLEGYPDKTTTGKKSVVDGRWHHIAVVRSRSKADGLRLYVDGQLDAQSSTNDLVLDANPNMFIGASPVDKSFFNGWLDEVAIYDRALTEEEIASRYELIARPRINYFSSEKQIKHNDPSE